MLKTPHVPRIDLWSIRKSRMCTDKHVFAHPHAQGSALKPGARRAGESVPGNAGKRMAERPPPLSDLPHAAPTHTSCNRHRKDH